ncbi:hypothetical protein [Pseudomonas beijingensis]|uniref:hypothetical protein n=1 Tax=Pseudomonas beijingensis TaxID=2954101 RepID=UPI0027344980|nr:hypothetical protein [Pseudomonas sp. FP2262]WLH47916.1 hypothetical protein PSH83_08355 [Pseudomonas sp. FP2262]
MRSDWVIGLLFVRWGFLLVFCLVSLCFSKNVLPYLFLFGLGIVLYFFGEREHISYLALFIFSYAVSEQGGAEVKKLFLKTALLCACLICFIFILSFLDVVERKVFVNTLGFSLEVRNGLGFYNPNPASLLLLSCTVVFLAFGRGGAFFLWLSVFWIFQVWLGSRTYILVSAIALLLCLIRREIRLLRIICVFLLSLVSLFPVLVLWVLEGVSYEILGVDINAVLSDRLNVMKLAFESSGGLGYFPSVNFVTIDPGFINFLGYFGVIIYYALLVVSLIAVFKERRGGVLIVMILFLLSNFTENAISPYNLMSLLFFVVVFESLRSAPRSSRVENSNI